MKKISSVQEDFENVRQLEFDEHRRERYSWVESGRRAGEEES